MNAKPKWQLTQEAFDKLLNSLSSDREEAGEKYLQLRKNLVRFFENRGFVSADEHADEIFNRLTRKLDAGEFFENINTYALGVARFLTLEIRKSLLSKMSDELPEIYAAPIDTEKIIHEQNLQCLEKCLLELPEESRNLIVNYYQGDKRGKIENRQKLGEKLGIPNNALRSRAVRLREKLEDCILGCRKKLEY